MPATEEDRKKRKRASLLLALLLLLTALILTIVTLDRGTREPERAAPARPSQTTSPSPAPSPISSATAPVGPGPSGAAGSAGGSGAGCVAEEPGSTACSRSFTLAGNTAGLFPGGTVQLPLTAENPNEEDIRVTLVMVSVAGTSASSCSASNLETTNYTGPGFVVPGNGSRTIALPVTMSRGAPDACQNVTFSLSYAGEAEEA